MKRRLDADDIVYIVFAVTCALALLAVALWPSC